MKPRRTFCGEACVAEWKFRTYPEEFRAVVFARDKGVCARCGLDTKDLDLRRLESQQYLAARIANLRPGEDWRRWEPEGCVETGPAGLPYPVTHWQALHERAVTWRAANRVKLSAPPWEADHVVEINEGGAPFDLDGNIVTLCVLCHREKTRLYNTGRKRIKAGSGR